MSDLGMRSDRNFKGLKIRSDSGGIQNKPELILVTTDDEVIDNASLGINDDDVTKSSLL